MKLVLKICLVLSFAFNSIDSFGQKALLRFADEQFRLERFHFAASEYERAFNKKPTYYAAKRIAESYDKVNDYEGSHKWWGIVIDFGESTKEDYSSYLISWMQAGKGLEFEQLLGSKGYLASDFPELFMLRNIYEKKSNVTFLGLDNINGKGSDYGLALGPNGIKYFASDRGEMIPTEKRAIRFDARNRLNTKNKYPFNDRQYFSIYSEDSSGSVKKLESVVPNTFHFSDPYYVEEPGLLFYTVTRGLRKVKRNGDYMMFPELYFSKISSEGELYDFRAFPLNDSLSHGIITPFVDMSTKRLYFSSDMEGGYGGYDLYYIEFDEDFNFGKPVNLGPKVNTAKNERDPYYHEGLLYFASEGHLGLGGMDIFSVAYDGDSLGELENMGLPFNSPRDDFAYVHAGRLRRYLSSDRQEGKGMDDIYFLRDLQKKFIGKVLECDGDLITENYHVELAELENGNLVSTDRGDKGEILADLDPEKDYTLMISKKGYFSVSDDSLTTKGLIEEYLEREYKLARIPYQLPVFADIIYYDLDKFNIREDARIELDRVAVLMEKYSFLDLLVYSHTDSRASDEYNDLLSERRADAVREYLVDYDISPSRIREEWFGEQQLTNDCGNGVPCPEYFHELNRRSELILEAFADPNKDYQLPDELKGLDACEIEGFFDGLQSEMFQIPIVYFDFDKSDLRPFHRKQMERVSLMMRRIENINLYLEGHTDQRGSERYNMGLAERRAKAVMDYLVKRGVDATRLTYEWFGKSRPIYDCGLIPCTEELHQLNRRTELFLRKND